MAKFGPSRSQSSLPAISDKVGPAAAALRGAGVCGARRPWRGAEGVGGVPGGAEGPPGWPWEVLGPLEMRAGANGWAIEGTQSGYAVLTRPRSGR